MFYKLEIVGARGALEITKWFRDKYEAYEAASAIARNSGDEGATIGIEEVYRDKFPFNSVILYANGRISRREIEAYDEDDARRRVLNYLITNEKEWKEFAITPIEE